jgi:hypothetical protein
MALTNRPRPEVVALANQVSPLHRAQHIQSSAIEGLRQLFR